MPEVHNQTCPLCLEPAKFTYADYENRKHFDCPNCVEFVISKGAESRLAPSTPEWRQQYSEMAKKSDEERILVITIPSGPKKEGVANPALQGKLVPRSR